ncbi:MarR family transcriptional regulator [Micromonospora tarensis]|uniref:MarR family transcriptional regulator n=1 Tax=Micromonospora tarensis TaxID=2806100 RepID=A0ABS1Y9A4_9ACTN|nr:MarR family transcriptional regulator [Micromonospora tarensis]MBM0273978.1 MarR family transcriptional regulator [Micromonospora tarensis]
MPDQPETVPPHALFKVLAALADLGDATAAAVAEHADLGDSTATAKLRVWEGTGQTERVQGDDKRAVWRLTDSGHATVGAGRTSSPTDSSSGPESPPDDSPSTGDAVDDDPGATSDTEQSGEQPTTPTPDNAADGEPPAADPHARADEPTAGDDNPTPTVDDDPPQAGTLDDSEAEAVATPDAASTAPGRSHRAKGSLRAAVLDILEAHPDRAYKTGELCKLIDAAEAGTGVLKARPGAVVNAAVKLVAAGKVVQTVEKPATFQLAPAAQ